MRIAYYTADISSQMDIANQYIKQLIKPIKHRYKMEIIFGNDKIFQFDNNCKYCMLNPPQRNFENVFSRCHSNG